MSNPKVDSKESLPADTSFNQLAASPRAEVGTDRIRGLIELVILPHPRLSLLSLILLLVGGVWALMLNSNTAATAAVNTATSSHKADPALERVPLPLSLPLSGNLGWDKISYDGEVVKFESSYLDFSLNETLLSSSVINFKSRWAIEFFEDYVVVSTWSSLVTMGFDIISVTSTDDAGTTINSSKPVLKWLRVCDRQRAGYRHECLTSERSSNFKTRVYDCDADSCGEVYSQLNYRLRPHQSSKTWYAEQLNRLAKVDADKQLQSQLKSVYDL